jgi:hypothetical protein
MIQGPGSVNAFPSWDGSPPRDLCPSLYPDQLRGSFVAVTELLRGSCTALCSGFPEDSLLLFMISMVNRCSRDCLRWEYSQKYVDIGMFFDMLSMCI